jgi:hypothetical protein
MAVVSVILFIIESPATTLATDGASDLIEGTVSGLLDAFYWSFTTLTSYVHKTPRTPAGVHTCFLVKHNTLVFTPEFCLQAKL